MFIVQGSQWHDLRLDFAPGPGQHAYLDVYIGIFYWGRRKSTPPKKKSFLVDIKFDSGI